MRPTAARSSCHSLLSLEHMGACGPGRALSKDVQQLLADGILRTVTGEGKRVPHSFTKRKEFLGVSREGRADLKSS